MKNLIVEYEAKQIATLLKNKTIPMFRAGDTVSVNIKVLDGITERSQVYEGVVIAKERRGISSSFTVRKISHGEGVERKFMTYSPMINKIKILKRGIVRRAKLFYLRTLSGKESRIKERRVSRKKI